MIGENICRSKTKTCDKKTVHPTARQTVNLMSHFNCTASKCILNIYADQIPLNHFKRNFTGLFLKYQKTDMATFP